MLLQSLGTALGILGWIGAVITCILPMWKFTVFLGKDIVSSRMYWEGIWMSCLLQSTGQMQCKANDSEMPLSSDLQAALILMVSSIVVGITAIVLTVARWKCTNCVKDRSSKVKLGIGSGVLFIVAGILCFIPVSWTANSITEDSDNMIVVDGETEKRDLGLALLFGWFAAVLMMIGGGMLCCKSPPKNKKRSKRAKYKAD